MTWSRAVGAVGAEVGVAGLGDDSVADVEVGVADADRLVEEAFAAEECLGSAVEGVAVGVAFGDHLRWGGAVVEVAAVIDEPVGGHADRGVVPRWAR